MGNSMDDDRLINIETKLAYQEETLAELNQVIYDQQKQITSLEKKIQKLSTQLQNAEGNSDIKSEPPPHY
jgi:SlyX protein